MPEGERDGRRERQAWPILWALWWLLGRQRRLPAGWAGLGCVLTGQRPVLVVQGLGQVLNSEIMLVT